jgi:hypothetical protein
MDQIFADMNFDTIYDHLIVGSHPGNAADIDYLHGHNSVRAIVNLQWGGEPDRGEIDEITARCALVGDRIWYQRVPIKDGDGDDLCQKLPEAVGILNRAIQDRAKEAKDMVYLHCCRGVSRSPSVAVAYLYWFTDRTLDEARDLVIQKRRVSEPNVFPNVPAIIGATNDILGVIVNGNIGAAQRAIIQGHVTGLRRVTNA